MMDVPNQIDTMWLLICTALVFFMQAGFCCLESGLSRSKNSINVAIKNVADFCIGASLFWLFGYAFMFGDSVNGFIGSSGFCFSDSSDSHWATAVFLFQMVFCGTAMTIVSGVVAERIRFRSYVVFVFIVCGVIYPIFGHWAWGSDGWLRQLGFIDFAGSTAVHCVGAWSALAATIIIGPRIGRFEAGAVVRQFSASNVPMVALGTFIIWFGWIGFNGGSALSFNGQVPSIILSTFFAGAAGGLAAMLWSTCLDRTIHVESILNGILAGLVGITASCNLVSCPAAMMIGAIAAMVMLAANRLLERFQIDDVVGAISVHGFAGIWGTVAVALWAPISAFQDNVTRWDQLGIQLLGASACFAWCFGVSYCALKIAGRLMQLRVSSEEERIGLNVSEHGSTNDLYDLLGTMQQNVNGNKSVRAAASPFTEAGVIAIQYNNVLDAEANLRHELEIQKNRTETILKKMHDAVITISDKGIIQEFNSAAERIFGYSEDEAVGQNVSILMPSPYAEEHDSYIARYVGARQSNVVGVGREVIGKRKDRTQFPMYLAVNEVLLQEEENGEWTRSFTGIVRNLTEQKRVQAELVKTKEDAELANQAKSDFLANMSHEIRTPMSAIIGFTDILKENANDPASVEAAETVERNGKYLLTLINDILDLSKVESGNMEVEKGHFSPMDLISEVAKLMAGRAEAKGLTLAVRVEGEIPDRIQSDATRLQQILINLVGNAIKFTESGSIQIVIRILNPSSENPQIRIDVVDTGIGLSPDKIEQIFKPFTQADSSTTRRFGGTGLGLTISRQLARVLGGDLVVTSKLGHGSTFSVMIATGPLDNVKMNRSTGTIVDGAQQDETQVSPEIASQINGCRILLAEDGLDNQRLISFVLKKAGAEIALATDGQSAYDVAIAARDAGQSFDVILMDIQMPILDGYTATQRLRESGYTGAIIALTAHAMSGDRKKCLSAGCDDYATKPIERQNLIKLVAHWHKQKSAQASSE